MEQDMHAIRGETWGATHRVARRVVDPVPTSTANIPTPKSRVPGAQYAHVCNHVRTHLLSFYALTPRR